MSKVSTAAPVRSPRTNSPNVGSIQLISTLIAAGSSPAQAGTGMRVFSVYGWALATCASALNEPSAAALIKVNTSTAPLRRNMRPSVRSVQGTPSSVAACRVLLNPDRLHNQSLQIGPSGYVERPTAGHKGDGRWTDTRVCD